MDEAVLDCRGLREEAHDLVAVVIAEGMARRSRRNKIHTWASDVSICT
jgi:hypothetical protein